MHNGCILCGGVGVGKSHTAVGYYLENEAPKDVYVITTAKKRDKQDWQFLWGDVGMTRDPKTTMGAVVTVDSWENIKKYEEVKDAFFIFDEQRLVGTGRWVKAFYKIAAANRWIMLSATPGDNWLDYVPVFRANGFIKNITQFKEDHVVARWTGRYYQVTGYRQVPKLVRWRNQLLVDMPYEKHTTRHHYEVAVEYDKDLVRELVNKRWHVYEERPLTDASELFRVMRKVVYTDASRLEAVRSLLAVHPKLIVFYNFDFELEMLRQLGTHPKASSEPSVLPNLSTAKESSTPSSPTTSSSTTTKSDGRETLDPTQKSTSSTTDTPEHSSQKMSRSSLKTTAQSHPSLPNSVTKSGELLTDSLPSDEKDRTPGVSTSTEAVSRMPGSSTSELGLVSTSLESIAKATTQSNSGWSYADNTCDLVDSPETVGTVGKITSATTSLSVPTAPCAESSNPNDQETDTWKKPTHSLPEPSEKSSLSVETNDTETSSERNGRNSRSLRRSSTSRQSTSSRTSTDPSTSTKDSGFSSDFQVAEWNGHKHEEVPTTTSWVYLVQYVAGAEAWECVETDAICFYSMPYSYKIWHQAHGRIDRLNTSFLNLHYYILYGGSIIEKSVKKSMSLKKSFNESALARTLGW